MDIRPLEFITELPPPLEAAFPEVTVWRDAAGEDAVFCATYGDWHWLRVVGVGSYRFAVGAHGSTIQGEVVPEGLSDARVMTDSYFRTAVPLAALAYGYEVLHGCAVSLPTGVVALCAPSESGKSTIANAMAERGHRVLADDSVVLSFEEHGSASTGERDATLAAPVVHEVPFALRLREPSATHFNRPTRDDVFVTAASRGGGEAGGPRSLAAVVLLSRRPASRGQPQRHDEGQGSYLTRLTTGSAFTHLLAEAKAFTLDDKARRRRMMSSYLRLVQQVPVYRLSYPTGLEHLDGICNQLEQLTAAESAAAPPATPTVASSDGPAESSLPPHSSSIESPTILGEEVMR